MFLSILDVNRVFFTVFEYPMSYIEFFGTIFTVWCVWLMMKAKVLSWPIGILGAILYIGLFYQIQLYSDLIEQIYFLVSSFIGWWVWLRPGTAGKNAFDERKISRNSLKENAICIAVIVLGTVALTYVTTHLTMWLPAYFSKPAAFPWLDAGTTVMSFTAQWLLVKKTIENWILWIIVDAIAICLYWYQGIRFVSLEYVLFFFLATVGLIRWIRQYKNEQKTYEPAIQASL